MLSDEVYTAILDKILLEELQPGEFINRRDLAKDLNVSVAPVLEAFKKLEQEGFLYSVPRKGTVIRDMTWQELKGHLIMREAIETAALEHISKQTILKHKDRLLQTTLSMAKSNVDYRTTWWADLDFHKELVSLAGLEILTQEFSRIALPCLLYFIKIHRDNTIGSYISSRPKDYTVNHEGYLQTVLGENKLLAKYEIRSHIWTTWRMVTDKLNVQEVLL